MVNGTFEVRAIPFNIHTPPVDEFSQNLPPKIKKIKVPTQHPPQKLTDFSFPPQKKANFSSNPSEKAAKIKESGRINPSETTFLAPSEKLVNRGGGGGGGGGGVYIKWNGPQQVGSLFRNYAVVLERIVTIILQSLLERCCTTFLPFSKLQSSSWIRSINEIVSTSVVNSSLWHQLDQRAERSQRAERNELTSWTKCRWIQPMAVFILQTYNASGRIMRLQII